MQVGIIIPLLVLGLRTSPEITSQDQIIDLRARVKILLGNDQMGTDPLNLARILLLPKGEVMETL